MHKNTSASDQETTAKPVVGEYSKLEFVSLAQNESLLCVQAFEEEKKAGLDEVEN